MGTVEGQSPKVRRLTSLTVVNDRWRGIMPFRRCRTYMECLSSERRTGEPSPAQAIYAQMVIHQDWQDRGCGKADGSFTEGMRLGLRQWIKTKHGSSLAPIAFQYRLSRKRVVTVIGRMPSITHSPMWGKGARGFIMSLRVDSIDGLPYSGPGKDVKFAWNRIIGSMKDEILALPAGVSGRYV